MPDTPTPEKCLLEKRGLPPVFRSGARLLILGSLPGDASLAAQRYYAHPRNQFWTLVGGVIGRDLPAMDYPARLEALAEARIALWDVVAGAVRPGSLDAALRDVRLEDVGALAARLPELRAVAFNGGTAARLGMKLAGLAHVRRIALPSSSPAYTAPLADKCAAWDALAQYL